MDSIAALIPGYNEGPRIAAVVPGARRHLPVVVVDDGSTDNTASFEVEMIARAVALDLPIAWARSARSTPASPATSGQLAHLRGFLIAARDTRRIVRAGSRKRRRGTGG